MAVGGGLVPVVLSGVDTAARNAHFLRSCPGTHIHTLKPPGAYGHKQNHISPGLGRAMGTRGMVLLISVNQVTSTGKLSVEEYLIILCCFQTG